jgi:hypothetical protein
VTSSERMQSVAHRMDSELSAEDLAVIIHRMMIERCIHHLGRSYDPAAPDKVAFIIRPEGKDAKTMFGFRTQRELCEGLLLISDGSQQDGCARLAADLARPARLPPGAIRCVVITEELAASYTIDAPWAIAPPPPRPRRPPRRR